MNINRRIHDLYKVNPIHTGVGPEILLTSSDSNRGGTTIIYSGGSGSGMTTEQIEKLDSIEKGALVNQNAISKITIDLEGASITLESTVPEGEALFKFVGDGSVITVLLVDHNIKIAAKDDVLTKKIEDVIKEKSYWKIDATGNLFTEYNAYSTKEISAYGMGESEQPTYASYLSELKDVDTSNLLNLGILLYNSVTGKWLVTDGSSIRPDLTGYAKESWVTSQLSSYATTTFVTTKISELVNGAPGALDTLYELSAALGNDPNFATTVLNKISANTTLINTVNTDLSNRITINTNNIASNKDIISQLNNMFEWDKSLSDTDSTKWRIKAKHDFYSIGEVAAYGNGGSISTIWDSMPIDPETLAWNKDGLLTVIGGGGGGSVDGIILNGTTYSPNEATKLITLPNYPTTLPASDVYAWAKASTKPNYAFSEITSRPNTLSGYGITDAVDIGGAQTITGEKTFTNLKVQGKSEKVFEVKSTTPNAYMQIIGASGRTAEFGSYANLDAYMQAPLLPGAPTLLLKSDGINSAAFGFNNLHYTLWHDGNISRNVERIFQGGWKTLDLRSYDQNTWYPCSINVSLSVCRLIIIEALSGRSRPSWSTHAGGFSLLIDMELNASGWGIIPTVFYLNNYLCSYGGETAFGGTEQNTMNSVQICWLRGGGIYDYWTNFGNTLSGNKDGYSWVIDGYSFSRSPRSTQGSPLTGFNIMRNHSDLCTLGRHTIRVNDSYDIGIGNNSGCLEVQSGGNEIVMTSGTSEIHVNYRGSSVGAGVPATWYWHQGAPGNWANFYIGNLIINGYNEHPIIINTSNPNESSIAYKIQNNLTFIAGSSTNNFFIWAPGKGDLFKAFNDGRFEFNGGSIYFNNNGIYCNSWLRTIGNCGWYSESYDGGIYMSDNQYIRIYQNKHFRTGGKISCGEYQDDAYGYMNVTRPEGDSYCCYSFVRNGTQAYGIGYNTNYEIVIGFPDNNTLWRHQALRISSSGMTLSGNFVATGEVTAFSDVRLKSDINDLVFRGKLRPRTYIKDSKQHIGFVALEVLELYPELVLESSSEEKYLALNYCNITAVLSSLINVIDDEVTILKKKVKQLENKLKQHVNNKE